MQFHAGDSPRDAMMSRHQQQQQQEEATSSLIPLARISSTVLATHCDIAFVRNPYYQFTDPSYCLTSVTGVARERLVFQRQVLSLLISPRPPASELHQS